MTLADDIKSMYKHTNDVYDSLAAIGVTLPENKNLENLADTFASINLKPPYDPDNPTVDGF